MYVNIWHGYRNLLLESSEVNIIVIVVLHGNSLAIGRSTIAIYTGCGLHRLCLAVLVAHIHILIVPV